jgi:hypothetical protein
MGRVPLRKVHAFLIPAGVGLGFAVVLHLLGRRSPVWTGILIAATAGGWELLLWTLQVGHYRPMEPEPWTARSIRARFPFDKFIEGFGPLRFEVWLRRLRREPEAHARFEPLVREAPPGPWGDYPVDLRKRILRCIDETPLLRVIADGEYALQCACMVRWSAASVTHPKSKSPEWKGLYDRLFQVLLRHGEDEKDFALVDDEVGEPGHKIEILNPTLLTRGLIAELQSTLVGWKNDWYVVVDLDVDELESVTLGGFLVVFPNRVEEHWDAEQLRRELGDRFRY